MMRCKIFTDPYYHSDADIDFDPNNVIAIESRTVSLFLRGKHKVIYITLKNGSEHPLAGDVADEIRSAQTQNR